MCIVTQYVSSFEEVVAFYDAWKAYAIPDSQARGALPPQWRGMAWMIDQHGDSGTCYLALKD